MGPLLPCCTTQVLARNSQRLNMAPTFAAAAGVLQALLKGGTQLTSVAQVDVLFRWGLGRQTVRAGSGEAQAAGVGSGPLARRPLPAAQPGRQQHMFCRPTPTHLQLHCAAGAGR